MNRELEQFFTSESVGRVLTSNLRGFRPRVAVDVGAGAGSLLRAVKQKWGEAQLLGIDIDKGLSFENLDGCTRLYRDGLDHTLPAFIQATCGHVDLVVSNPPYTAITRNRDADIILEEAGLLNVVGRSEKYPAELIFLAQNLRILREDGFLAIIVPSGIINGDRWRELRRVLCLNNRVETVVELPENAFEHTEAKTFILILQKGRSTSKISLRQAFENGGVSTPKEISVRDAIFRMDWSYYSLVDETPKNISFTLRELNADVFRGNLSSAQAREIGVPTFHTSDLTKEPTKVRLGKIVRKTQHKTARKGDILVARVGSRCLGRIAMVSSGGSIVTDCIYVVRLPKNTQDYVWNSFLSLRTSSYLQKVSRGVCAKYITKQQLLDVPLFS